MLYGTSIQVRCELVLNICLLDSLHGHAVEMGLTSCTFQFEDFSANLDVKDRRLNTEGRLPRMAN
jgi:hypothetical protein